MKKIILASKSPRRLEILRLAGIEPVILVPEADESKIIFESGNPQKYVGGIAMMKNDAALPLAKKEGFCDGIIISADTVVYSIEEDKPLGKPKDHDDAFRMLTSLSNRTHKVISGVVIRDIKSGKTESFEETTEVTFRKIFPNEIEKYINEYSPYDKAGSYGIQDGACVFVSRISGDYYNVVGLPICKTSQIMREFAD